MNLQQVNGGRFAMPRKNSRTVATNLGTITKTLLTTAEAAAALSYAPSTLRQWAATGVGPIQPVRISDGTHLRWHTNDVRRISGLGPLPEVLSPADEAKLEAAARETRDKGLRAELTTLRQSFARIEALVGSTT
jgi:hypothetical protein